jgi:hypothetical protein
MRQERDGSNGAATDNVYLHFSGAREASEGLTIIKREKERHSNNQEIKGGYKNARTDHGHDFIVESDWPKNEGRTKGCGAPTSSAEVVAADLGALLWEVPTTSNTSALNKQPIEAFSVGSLREINNSALNNEEIKELIYIQNTERKERKQFYKL